MPLYDYKCREHGLFYALQTMDKFDQPAPCPDCGAASARVILLAPDALTMPREKHRAHETNERARHEPMLSNRDQREHDREHRDQCGCSRERTSNLIYTAQGDKMFPSMRPWMISH